MCEKEVLRYHLRLFVFTPWPAPRPPPPSLLLRTSSLSSSISPLLSYFFAFFSLHSKTPVKTAAHGNRTSMFITLPLPLSPWHLFMASPSPTPPLFVRWHHRRICLVPFRHIFVCISSIRQTMATCKLQPGLAIVCVSEVCEVSVRVCVCNGATIGRATPCFLGGLLQLCVCYLHKCIYLFFYFFPF